MLNPTPTLDQATTIQRLENLTGGAWTVEAGPLDETATQGCSIDYAHGPGTVCLPGCDELCPGCALAILDAGLCSGDYVSVDVLRQP